MNYEWPISKKKIYYVYLFDKISLFSESRTNGDFREQIVARDCNDSEETKKVVGFVKGW